jgi:hypothetical protein
VEPRDAGEGSLKSTKAEPASAFDQEVSMGAKTVKSIGSTVVEDPNGEVTMEEIAARAYEIHASEGGHDVENWLRAERELNAELGAQREVDREEAEEDAQAAA